jgi:hypothetical protein
MTKPVTPSKELIAERDTLVRTGLALTESTSANGGFAEFFSKNDGTDIEDPVLKAHTALMMENARNWMGSIDESTLSLTVGGYRDYVLPIVRASFPSNPVNQLVSVQPMTRRNGTIYWLNYIIEQTRGSFKRGETLFDANNGWKGRVGYTDEQVNGESMGVTVANATQTGTFAEVPLRAGSAELSITDAGPNVYVLRDNGNGGFTIVSTGGGAKTLSASSINYVTGAWSVTFSAALAASGAMSGSYTTNGEGTYVKPQIGLEIQSTGVQAIRRALGIRVSMESMQDMKAEFGTDPSEFLISGASQQIMADQAGHIVQDLWTLAGTAAATFDATVPTGVNRAEHYRDIAYEINVAAGVIENATQRGTASWMIVDQKAANVLRTAGAAGGFVTAGPEMYKGQGLVFIGTFNGLPVYKYKFMSAFPNAAAGGNILMGYKGPDWFDAGYVLAPYQQFYSSGPDNRADMTMRQSFAMRYATKTVNPAMYVKVSLTGT